MPESARLITNTTAFPAYTSKALFFTDLEEIERETTGRAKSKIIELRNRLSNTDTSDWADTDGRHDD
jgi:hypothetical protein